MAFKTITRWYGNAFNDRIRDRLRSSNPGSLGKNHLLLTMTGRRTGTQYSLPVNYKQTPAGTYIIGTEASWWQNLKGGAAVEISVEGESLEGHAEPIIDDSDKRERYGKLIAGPAWFFFSKSLILIEVTVKERPPP
jgi:deazaflavin-dependent oxidoreductase (nitroreductase family)